MASKRRSAPKRPAKRVAKPAKSGGRVSGSVSVAPKLTIFGGGLLSFNFGGGGKGRGRRGGGLLKRLTGLAVRGYREMTNPTSGKISPTEKGRSFDEFKAGRPDLFDDQGPEDDDQDDDGAPVEGNGHGEGGAHEGPTYGAKDVCDACQGVHGHHWHGCVRGTGGAR